MTPAGAGTKQPLEWETAIFRETSSGKRASRQHSWGWLAFDALLLISRLKMYPLPEWENRAITSVSEDARSPCLNFNYTTKKKSRKTLQNTVYHSGNKVRKYLLLFNCKKTTMFNVLLYYFTTVDSTYYKEFNSFMRNFKWNNKMMELKKICLHFIWQKTRLAQACNTVYSYQI